MSDKNYEHKPGKGSAFKNKKKTEGGPDYTGDANIDGKIKRIGVWINKDKNGDTYFGFSFSDPKPKEQTEPAARPTKEDLPF